MEAFDIRTDLKDMTNDLVPRNDRIACGDLTVCDMQIGTTDTASDDPDEKLAGARTRDGPLDAPQVRGRPVELHGDSSEERRVGTECSSQCESRRAPYP